MSSGMRCRKYPNAEVRGRFVIIHPGWSNKMPNAGSRFVDVVIESVEMNYHNDHLERADKSFSISVLPSVTPSPEKSTEISISLMPKQ